MAVIAVYPGTFDPITHGHMDIIRCASRLFSQVIVAIGENTTKGSLLSQTDRFALVSALVSEIKHVSVCTFSGLLIDFLRKQQATVIVRGVRGFSDFDGELCMASMYQQQQASIETVFLTSRPVHSHISSSLVREIALMGGDVTPFVADSVAQKLQQYASSKLLGSKDDTPKTA